MAEARKQNLTIHRSNLFHPTPLGITNLALSPEKTLLAVTREHVSKEKVNAPLTIVQIYQVFPNLCPKPLQSIVEYESLVGITWVSPKMILSASREQTINIYKSRDGSKVATTMTDYGPILCMKYHQEENLLFTGTEYGYVAVYTVDLVHKKVELLSRMVKVSGKICSIDYVCKQKQIVQVEQSKPKPGKRKRKQTDSSDDEAGELDEDELPKEANFLDSHDITIYGACDRSVIVWDFHRKTIKDTVNISLNSNCRVLSVLALKNGDFIAGDSTGTINIFDAESLTCKQTMNILRSGVSCLTTDARNSDLVVSGEDPTIVTLKSNKQGDFVLFDNMQVHTHLVTSMLVTKKGLLSGALDGRLIKFEKQHGKGLSKIITLPDNTDKIKFAKGEMLVQGEKSLTIWRLPPPTNSNSPRKAQASLEKDPDHVRPVKLLLVRARTFIHASTFSDKWVSYSTKNDLHIFDRTVEGLKSYRPEQKLPNCNVLELCSSDQYLAAASQRYLFLIDLEKSKVDEVPMDVEGDQRKTEAREAKSIVQKLHLKSSIRQVLNLESMGLLVIACSSPKNYIYIYKFQPKSDTSLVRQAKFCLGDRGISFITYNSTNKRDSNIYVYTTCNRLIRMDLKKPVANLSSQVENQDRIDELPENASILGMVIVSKEHCILYDNDRIFKLDIKSNRIVNMISNYKYIMRMDNFAFQKLDQVALAELTPNDYNSLLPKCAILPKKFGKS